MNDEFICPICDSAFDSAETLTWHLEDEDSRHRDEY